MADGAVSKPAEATSLLASLPGPPSPSHAYDDIDALVAWPALEKFMEDLSDLDENGNATMHEKADQVLDMPPDPLGRARDPLAGGPLYAAYNPKRGMLLPSPSHLPWAQSINLPLSRGGVSSNSISSVLSGRSVSMDSLAGGCGSCGGSSSSHALPPQVRRARATAPKPQALWAARF